MDLLGPNKLITCISLPVFILVPCLAVSSHFRKWYNKQLTSIYTIMISGNGNTHLILNQLPLNFVRWWITSGSWWRHQMETFSALLALRAWNSPVPVNSPHKGQWRGALMFSLICARINGWVNNRKAGDLRRHCGHYGVDVMWLTDQYGSGLFLKWNSYEVWVLNFKPLWPNDLIWQHNPL